MTSSAACSTAARPTRTQRFSTARGPRRGSDVEGEVTVDFIQAIEGVTVGMQMVSDAACEACHGTGAKAGTIPHVCPTCEGSGMQTSTSGGVFAVTEPCRDCRGRGMVVDDPCPVCHGSGRGKSTRTMQVRIPAGVTDGQRIRLKGKGGAGENGGAAGDLYVIVHVRPHPIFGRKGDNLTLIAPVTFNEAALGAEIEVPTLGAPAGEAPGPAGHAERPDLPGPGQGCGQAGRHQGRSAGHRRGDRARIAQRAGSRGAHVVRRSGRFGQPAREALRHPIGNRRVLRRTTAAANRS